MPDTSPLASPRPVSQWNNGLHISTHLYLAVGMALLIGMLVASYMQASAGLDALKQYGIANQQADRLDRLSQLLADAQSASRGYALTRDAVHLSSYRVTVPKIQNSLELIKQSLEEGEAPGSAALLRHAESVASRLATTMVHIDRGDPLEETWFDQAALEMAAYRSEHNAIKLALLTKNVENVKLSMNSFENARLSNVLLAIASLLLLLLAISQKQKKQELQEKVNHLLEAKNERLEHEVQSRTLELTNLATYLTDVREREKLRLARELHDELGALLTAAKLDADWIERKLPDELKALLAPRLQRLRQNLVGGITLKRRFTNDLRPALLHDLGLVEALRALIEEFREAEEIEVKADLPEAEPEFSEEVSLSLFRIVQETFTNIRKYAHARHVGVALRLTPTSIELSIEDDGVGFDLDSPKIARHGLAGIKHRVFTHGGELDIRTSPGAGVAISISLPRDA